MYYKGSEIKKINFSAYFFAIREAYFFFKSRPLIICDWSSGHRGSIKDERFPLANVSQVIKDIDDTALIIAYAVGFSAGIIFGSYIERMVGVGNIIVRVFSPSNSPSVAEKLRENGHGVTVIDGQGKDGPVKVYLCIIKRRKLKSVLKMIEEINPKAYITTDLANPTSLKK